MNLFYLDVIDKIINLIGIDDISINILSPKFIGTFCSS